MRKNVNFRIVNISIHAPYEGGDGFIVKKGEKAVAFQSTPPMKGATYLGQRDNAAEVISIHAPYEGGDC